MKTLKFRCTLLSDVILNQKAASEGANMTLDFIPGNTFLGIVARHYNEFEDKALEVFHSGKVRFGDAHPVCAAHNNMRTLRVPAMFFYPKGKDEPFYVSHIYQREKDVHKQQLKQCRNGFYAMSPDDKCGYPVTTDKSFAIKSAYDRTNLRSMDEKMYGYESLGKGLQLLFSVEVDDDTLATKIHKILVGKHHIGRSRTAQYGSVKIEDNNFEETPSRSFDELDDKKFVTVYADSRLIFIDDSGEPTFRPTAADLGIEGGTIDWERSQVRTFQYAPWNGCRQTRDADRCGIEKGSVFVVTVADKQTFKSKYVGAYRNEGFGRVIYNPEFLDAEDNAPNGEAKYTLKKSAASDNSASSGEPIALSGTPLLNYLNAAKLNKDIDEYIYRKVNEFVDGNRTKFQDDRFASQWGAIRTIAMQYVTHDAIMRELFNGQEVRIRTRDNIKETVPAAYLTHGVAKDKWEKQGRKTALKEFIDEIHQKGYGDITAKALINLASEMAKICTKKS